MFLHRAMRYYRLWIYSCNLVLLVSVVAFVSTAAWTLSDYRMSLLRSVDLRHPSFLYAYLALALQGGVLQAIGCLGALRMSERLLNAYWTLMLLLLAGDLALGLVWLFRFGALAGGLREQLRQRLLGADYADDAEFQLLWDRLQAAQECCGVDGPRDFAASEWLRRERQGALQARQLVPRSCCRMAAVAAQAKEPQPLNASCVETDRGDLVHEAGCHEGVHRWLTHAAHVLAVLGYCVVAFLKLCFLGILRYEIREMIQKIKVLRDMSESPGLMDPGGPASLLPGSALAQKMRRQRSEQGQQKPPPNGNNNEADQQPPPPNSPSNNKKSSSPV